MKRLLDILVSAAALVLLAGPMLLIAVLIRRESPGDPIFRQRRAGWKGRPFVMLKFRTMRTDVDPYAPSPHGRTDPRLTPLGLRLRETSLDELPQLINVLWGEMSLVGPRPLYERQAAQWNDRQRRRLEVRPGMTGWAQVRGRGDLTIEEKIELDLFYVDNRSVGLDMKIVWWTVAQTLHRRGEDIYEKQYSAQRVRETDSHG